MFGYKSFMLMFVQGYINSSQFCFHFVRGLTYTNIASRKSISGYFRHNHNFLDFFWVIPLICCASLRFSTGVTWMTLRTSCPLCWLADYTSWRDLVRMPPLYISAFLPPPGYSTPSPISLLCLSRVELCHLLLDMWLQPQWLLTSSGQAWCNLSSARLSAFL